LKFPTVELSFHHNPRSSSLVTGTYPFMDPNRNLPARTAHSRVLESPAPHLSCPSCERRFSSISGFKKHVRTMRHHAPGDSGRQEPSTNFNDEPPASPPTHSTRLGPHQDMSPISSPNLHPQPCSPTLSRPLADYGPLSIEGDLSHLFSPRPSQSPDKDLDHNPLSVEGDLSYLFSSRPSQSPDKDDLDRFSMPDSPLSQIYSPLDPPNSPLGPYSPPSPPDSSPSSPPSDLPSPPGSPSGSPPSDPPRDYSAQPADSNHDHTTDRPPITRKRHPIINGM
jgi:hypothetical protein